MNNFFVKSLMFVILYFEFIRSETARECVLKFRKCFYFIENHCQSDIGLLHGQDSDVFGQGWSGP